MIEAKYNWGTWLWGYIHTICIIDTEDMKTNVDLCISRLKALSSLFPCKECYKHFYEYIAKLDYIDVYKPMELFKWSVDLHNSVNQKLGKQQITYDKAMREWCMIIPK